MQMITNVILTCLQCSISASGLRQPIKKLFSKTKRLGGRVGFNGFMFSRHFSEQVQSQSLFNMHVVKI